jgi:hypothetical protein
MFYEMLTVVSRTLLFITVPEVALCPMQPSVQWVPRIFYMAPSMKLTTHLHGLMFMDRKTFPSYYNTK